MGTAGGGSCRVRIDSHPACRLAPPAPLAPGWQDLAPPRGLGSRTACCSEHNCKTGKLIAVQVKAGLVAKNTI